MRRIWTLVLLIGLSLGEGKASDCSTLGKFPNNELPGCRGFTTCTQIGAKLFYSYDLGCPATFIFNHFDKQCSNVTGYVCFPQYNCTREGNFENIEDKNCTSYVACIAGMTSNIVAARLIQCPPNTMFSPIVGDCVNETLFTCPRKEIPVTVSTTTTTEQPENIPVTPTNTSIIEMGSESNKTKLPSAAILMRVNYLLISFMIVTVIVS